MIDGKVIDGKVIDGPPLDTPQALALHREPKANVEHYDPRTYNPNRRCLVEIRYPQPDRLGRQNLYHQA